MNFRARTVPPAEPEPVVELWLEIDGDDVLLLSGRSGRRTGAIMRFYDGRFCRIGNLPSDCGLKLNPTGQIQPVP